MPTGWCLGAEQNGQEIFLVLLSTETASFIVVSPSVERTPVQERGRCAILGQNWLMLVRAQCSLRSLDVAVTSYPSSSTISVTRKSSFYYVEGCENICIKL